MRRRLDLYIIAASTLASLGIGVDAILAAPSRLHMAALAVATAVAVCGSLALAIRGMRDSERTESRVNYLQNVPEAYREADRQYASWGVTATEAHLFNDKFGYHGNGSTIVATCRVCDEYETSPSPLGQAVAAGVEHLRSAHKIPA